MRDVTADYVDLSESREKMVALNPPDIDDNLYVNTAADVSIVRDDGNSYKLEQSNETLTIDNKKITRAAGPPKAGRFYEVL